MDLIQNHVLNREGKKWKQRWAVLKKATPKSFRSSADFVCYLYLYKDASHAKEGKEKAVLPIDLCGLDVSKQYDKANNVLVIITLSQTVYLSFNQRSILDQWHHILIEHFGQAVSYDISIPDKQKLKPGQATLRLYQSFFSIVTSKNFRCLNRWYISDINIYSAVDKSHFMFEIAPPMKSKGFVVNLLVPDNAEEVARAFDGLMGQMNASALAAHNYFHGSAILDELGQAKRNAGDHSFFRRVILRASNVRIRKKRRGRALSSDGNVKRKNISSPTLEEAKYRSLDRRKSPDLSVDLSDVSALKAMQIARSKSEIPLSKKQSESEAVVPELPKKKISKVFDESYKVDVGVEINGEKKSISEKLLLKPRSMTTSDIPAIPNENSNQGNISRSAEHMTEPASQVNELDNVTTIFNVDEPDQGIDVQPSDRSDIVVRQARASADSYTSTSLPAKHPAKYFIDKTKKPKTKPDVYKTPTPPPRSPVSLGLQPTSMFVYPSSENINEEEKNISLLDEINDQLKRTTIHSDASDDAFLENGEPSPRMTNNNISSCTSAEPLHRNMNVPVRNFSDSNTVNIDGDVMRRQNFHRDSKKHLSDPLIVDSLKESTGRNSTNITSSNSDYVNVKATSLSDDENDSYVNISATNVPSASNGKSKCKPQPLRMKNNFMIYDGNTDDAEDVYHAVAGVDGNSSSSLDGGVNLSNGSYENVNAPRRNDLRKPSEYLNLPMSPSSVPTSRNSSNASALNYILVSGNPDVHPSGYKSSSPIRPAPRSPDNSYSKSNYIIIDESATNAIKRSVEEHARNTPTKITK